MTYSDFTSEPTDPDWVKRIPQLNAAFANVKQEKGNAANDHRA